MANIKEKNINDLSDWNMKELRKLKIMLKNRLTSYETAAKPKELQKSHILHELSQEKCKEILDKAYEAEKKLAKKS